MAFILLGVRPVDDGKKETPNVVQVPVDGPSHPCDSRVAPCAMVDGEYAKRMAEVEAQFKKLDKELFERLEEKNFMGRLMKGQFNKDNFSELAECFGILSEADCRLALIEGELEDEECDLSRHVDEFRTILNHMADDAEACMDRILGVDRDDEDEDEDPYEDCDGCCDGCPHAFECEDYDDDYEDCDDADIFDKANAADVDDDIMEQAKEIIAEHDRETRQTVELLKRHDFRTRMLTKSFTKANYEEMVSLVTRMQRLLYLSRWASMALLGLLKDNGDANQTTSLYILAKADEMEGDQEAIRKVIACCSMWLDNICDEQAPLYALVDDSPAKELFEDEWEATFDRLKVRLSNVEPFCAVLKAGLPSLEPQQKRLKVPKSLYDDTLQRASKVEKVIEDLKGVFNEAFNLSLFGDNDAVETRCKPVENRISTDIETMRSVLYHLNLWLTFANVEG